MENTNVFSKKDWLTVLVVAFGYFVDIYDILLFGIVRVASLKSLSACPKINSSTEDLLKQTTLSQSAFLTDTGLFLQNWQMVGFIVGGLIAGIIADKKGRISVLFGSILLYSIANIANAYVTNIDSYSALRFFAGVGLAGEIVGFALVSEVLLRNKRTIGTMIVSSIGLLGGVAAAIVGTKYSWETSYLIGGGMGLILLVFRLSIHESSMFKELKSDVKKGSLIYLFSQKKLLLKYIYVILSGAAAFVFTGIFINFSPELSKKIGVTEPISVAQALICYMTAFTISDIIGSLISKKLKSRKVPLLFFCVIQVLAVVLYLFPIFPLTSFWFYVRCTILGIGLGYWGILITNAAEQFGTNLRATVTTSASNFIRGLAIPATLLFSNFKLNYGTTNVAFGIAMLFIGISAFAIYKLDDKFEASLDYID